MTDSTDDPAIDRDMPASRIAMKFGSVYKFAKALEKSHGTVHRWIVKGFIPVELHRAVVLAARALGIELSADDFVDTRIFAK